jgi:hypothetical protein
VTLEDAQYYHDDLSVMLRHVAEAKCNAPTVAEDVLLGRTLSALKFARCRLIDLLAYKVRGTVPRNIFPEKEK